MTNNFFELDKNSFSRSLGRIFCKAVEISHPDLSQIYYLTNDLKELVINGNTYIPFPFDTILPSQTEQQGTQIVLSNVNNMVAKELNSIVNSNEPLICKLYFINREENDAIQILAGIFEITEPIVTNESITATMNIRHSLEYNIGTIRYNNNKIFNNLSL